MTFVLIVFYRYERAGRLGAKREPVMPVTPGRPVSSDAADSTETWVRRGPHRIYARSYARTTGPHDTPGAEPERHAGAGAPLVLLHGFPDNLHLYDRLVPYLRPARRVVSFDFLGWGASDKPAGYPYTAANQTGDLDAVLDQLGLERVVLVAHDASGPPAFWRLNDDLLGTVFSRRRVLPRLRTFARPVRIVFGAADPYLNAAVARRFHELFPHSELFLLPTARHYVQVDEPAEVARLILALPG